jgi:hypothetical protein
VLWLNPMAALGLAALASPILIHLLVRQRAPRVPFPTLRFIRPFQLAAIRRRTLDDAGLLVVRGLILAGAVAASAAPLLVSAARVRTWDARTYRAEVRDGAAAPPESAGATSTPGSFSSASIRDGLRRAVSWLERQPPGRRAITVRSAFPLGSLDDADIAAVPAAIGLAFERTEVLPPARTIRIQPVVENGTHVEREVTLAGDRTSVRDVSAAAGPAVSIDLEAPPDQQPAVDALTASIARDRLVATPPGRSARIVFGATMPRQGSIAEPWMADAAFTIARRMPLEWQLSFAGDGARLVVSTPAAAVHPGALGLVRAVAGALAPAQDYTSQEVLSIPDAQLRAWSREAAPAAVPQAPAVERDDRRWAWGLVVALLLAEWRMRRSRGTRTAAPSADVPAEAPRVA